METTSKTNRKTTATTKQVKEDILPKKETTATTTPTEQPENKPMVHVDAFIKQATTMLGLTHVQQSGFKAYMYTNQYLKTLDDFIPYLETYLGKKL